MLWRACLCHAWVATLPSICRRITKPHVHHAGLCFLCGTPRHCPGLHAVRVFFVNGSVLSGINTMVVDALSHDVTVDRVSSAVDATSSCLDANACPVSSSSSDSILLRARTAAPCPFTVCPFLVCDTICVGGLSAGGFRDNAAVHHAVVSAGG